MLASSSRNISVAKKLTGDTWQKHAWIRGRCRCVSMQANAESADFPRRSVLLPPLQVSTQTLQRINRTPGRSNSLPKGSQSLIDRYNNQLEALADAGRVPDVLKLCALMKTSGIRPNRITYNALLQAFGSLSLHVEALATIYDMKAMGIPPDVDEYNYLLNALRFSSSHAMRDVFDSMIAEGITPDAITYLHVIRRYVSGGNLELAIQMLAQMNSKQLAPPLKLAQAVICEALDFGYVRLAFDMSESFEQTSIHGLDSEVWTKLLIGSSQSLYADGVKRCWKRVVEDFKIRPDEGLCLDVLHTASRHGMPMLAASAIEQLETTGVHFREHHLAPFLEAFAVNGNIKEAFQAIQLFGNHGIEASSDTLLPLLKSIQHDPDAVDSAWIALEDLQKEEVVDVAAANVIIEATVVLGDLQRTVGILKSMPSLGLTPNIKTYILLLSACVKARHRDLGDKIWRDMKAASISPSAEAYEALISLCLTQPAYEDAFFYLEEMKEQNFKPSYRLYETLIRKCIDNGDTRYRLAVDELKSAGYRLSRKLGNFLKNGGDMNEDVITEEIDGSNGESSPT